MNVLLVTCINEQLGNKTLNMYACQTLCKAILIGIMELDISTTVL